MLVHQIKQESHEEGWLGGKDKSCFSVLFELTVEPSGWQPGFQSENGPEVQKAASAGTEFGTAVGTREVTPEKGVR